MAQNEMDLECDGCQYIAAYEMQKELIEMLKDCVNQACALDCNGSSLDCGGLKDYEYAVDWFVAHKMAEWINKPRTFKWI